MSARATIRPGSRCVALAVATALAAPLVPPVAAQTPLRPSAATPPAGGPARAAASLEAPHGPAVGEGTAPFAGGARLPGDAAPASAHARSAGPPADATAADARPAPVWTERRGLLSSARWWVDPAQAEALGDADAADAETRIEWAVADGEDEDLSDDERFGLMETKLDALAGARPARRADADATSPADAAPAPARGPWRIVARITEVWQPNRLVNLLLAMLPWPMAPFYTQGGAAVELEVVDTARAVTVARVECRRYAGILQFYNAFRRIAHSRSALSECARVFVATLRGDRAAPPAAPVAPVAPVAPAPVASAPAPLAR